MHGRSGGAAMAGGAAFQAVGTAVCLCAALTGCVPSWIKARNLNAVLAETGGPGDDIVLETDIGRIEIQAKKGLTGGSKLWQALEPIVQGLDKSPDIRAILLVDTTTSNTIKNDLARDLRRIADGRQDDLSAIGQAALDRLAQWGLKPTAIARRLDVVTLDSANARELMRRDLTPLCTSNAQVSHALTWLENEALRLIENRGRRDLTRLVTRLRHAGLELSSTADLPASHLFKLTGWVERTTKSFSVLGAPKRISIESGWLSLDVKHAELPRATDLEDALHRYHTDASGGRSTDTFDVEWLGRFVPRCVLIGGPGSGKSLAAQMIARRYAQDGFPVLRVSLNQLAARVQAGASVEEACWQLGLSGSGLTVEEARYLPDWIVVADGLDECGPATTTVAEGLARLGEGNPSWRIIVTTRPIGYDTTHLADWQHYRLVDLDETAVSNGVNQLIEAISGLEVELSEWDLKAAPSSFKSTLSRSPLLIALTASLVAAGQKIEGSRSKLYRSMVSFIEEVSVTRQPPGAPDAAVRGRVLEMLGWVVVGTPLAIADQVDKQIASFLAKELDTTQLAAARVAEFAVDYWCRVGLVERVRHLDHSVYTFAHRTFAEFTAAKRLVEAYGDDESTLEPLLGNPVWTEVIKFAARLGVAEPVVDYHCRCSSLPAVAANNLDEALQIVAASEVALLLETVQRVFDEATTFANSGRQDLLAALADGLVRAAARHPEVAHPHSISLANGPTVLSQVVGCHMALAAQGDLPSLTRARGILPALWPLVEDRTVWGGKGLRHSARATGFVGNFLKDILSFALDHLTEEERLTVLAEIKPYRESLHVGFARDFEDILTRSGLENWLHTNPNRTLGKTKSLSAGFKRMAVSWNASIRRVVPNSRDNTTGALGLRHPLLQLSALAAATGWWECTPGDTVSSSDNAALEQEVIEMLLPLLPIDQTALAIEASSLPAPDSEEAHSMMLGSFLAKVDVPEPNWSMTALVDTSLLAEAIQSTSPWIARVATKLLAHQATPEDKLVKTRSLLGEATGEALWEATSLALEQPQDEAIVLLSEALNAAGPGRRHALLQGVKTLGIWDKCWLDHCRSALKSDSVEDAVAAANLIAKLAPNDADIFEMARVAELDWEKKEAPYPTEGGVVPRSPRAPLLGYRERNGLPIADLVAAVNDPRSDVNDVALTSLRRITATDTLGAEQLADVFLQEVLDANILVKLLEGNIEPGNCFLDALVHLLDHKSPDWRLAALHLVEKAALTTDQKQKLTAKLLEDYDEEIRRRAELIHAE